MSRGSPVFVGKRKIGRYLNEALDAIDSTSPSGVVAVMGITDPSLDKKQALRDCINWLGDNGHQVLIDIRWLHEIQRLEGITHKEINLSERFESYTEFCERYGVKDTNKVNLAKALDAQADKA